MFKLAIGLLVVTVALLAMLLTACGGGEAPDAPAAAGQLEATNTAEATMEEATPTPGPTPVVLGNCRDGMRLQPGEGCRYTGGGSPQANVVLSVQHDGAICREGGPAKQEIGDITVTVDSLRLCYSGGFERDDAFQSDIVAGPNADGSWTFYDSALSASASISTATAAPPNTPTPTPSLNAYESGQTIPDFPSGIPNAIRGGASMQISGGNVVITMGNGGTVEYSHTTYTCVSAEECSIENGRVTAGTIRVTDPSNVESPTPIPTAAATLIPTATPTPKPTAAPTATPTPQPTPTPTPTPTPPPTPSPTPAGPVVEVNSTECNITQEYIGGSYFRYDYEVTGEVYANRDIENVQVGFGVGNFSEIGSGNHIYTGFPGDSETLGSMSAGESKSFSLFILDPSSNEILACRIEVVWTERR